MISVRHFGPGDADSVVRLLNDVLLADQITHDVFLRKVLLDPNFRSEGALVAEDGGVVGFALGIMRKIPIEDQTPDIDRGYLTLMGVAPGHQRRGTGTELLRRLFAYYQEYGAKSVWVSPYAPNYFTPGVDVNAYPGALEFFRKNGFVEAYRPLSMDASLVGLRTPDWVRERVRTLGIEGVAIEPFRSELTLPLLDFLRREFPGDWQRHIRESLSSITLGGFRADQMWVAHHNGRVLGFAQHDGERFGPFGVAASERGRAIGAGLLFQVLHTMRTNGLHNAWFLWTDDKTAKLYSEAGFTETRRYAVMKKTPVAHNASPFAAFGCCHSGACAAIDH